MGRPHPSRDERVGSVARTIAIVLMVVLTYWVGKAMGTDDGYQQGQASCPEVSHDR